MLGEKEKFPENPKTDREVHTVEPCVRFINDDELSVAIDDKAIHIDILRPREEADNKNIRLKRIASILARIAGRSEDVRRSPVTKETTSYSILRQKALLDATHLETLSPLELGEALPRTYGDHVEKKEAVERLQELAAWINPDCKEYIQDDFDGDRERAQKLEADDTTKLFNSRMERFVGAREYNMTRVTLALGLLSTRNYGIAHALRKMKSPDAFLLDCHSDLDELQATHNTIESVQAKLSEVNEAIRAIGENSSLASEKQATALELQSVELELRKKSLRFCTLAMLYDKGQPLPVAGFSRTLDDEPADRSPSWHTAIDSIASLHTESTCEDFTKLLHDITQALYNVRGDLDDPEINTQLAQYLVHTSKYATNLSRVQSLRNEISSRYSDYINIP